MAMTIYMKVTGKNQGEIKGDCTQQGRENLILCYFMDHTVEIPKDCLLYTSPSPRDRTRSRMPSSA